VTEYTGQCSNRGIRNSVNTYFIPMHRYQQENKLNIYMYNIQFFTIIYTEIKIHNIPLVTITD